MAKIGVERSIHLKLPNGYHKNHWVAQPRWKPLSSFSNQQRKKLKNFLQNAEYASRKTPAITKPTPPLLKLWAFGSAGVVRKPLQF